MRSIGRWATVLAAVLAASCGTRQDTISRVQPNALDKSFFENSDWYSLSTVVDTDYGAPLPVGDASSFSKVEFEIQEEFLIARRTHEFIRNGEGEGISSEGEPNRIVAMYNIESHFDIRRDYNPVTGEEQNVIVENDSDRPWYDREFFRVDWSRNLVEAPDFSVTGGTRNIKLTPFNYFEQNDDGQAQGFAPRFEEDEDGRIVYFDLVSKYLAEPLDMTFELPNGSTFSIAACLLILNSYMDCAPSEISVRQSFMRVEDRDYEPTIYTSDRMDRFGYFLHQRDGYDPAYGLSRDERKLFVQRHNLWEQSHQRDALGARLACVTDEQCGGNGARCDMAWAAAFNAKEGACTIPFRDREVRPVVYYTSLGYPENLLNDSYDLANGWDRAFRETVASLRAIECAEWEGRSREDCNAEYTPESVSQIFHLCQNPVPASASEVCGPEGRAVEIGDIRYHMLGYVPEPHSAAPLGFGPSFTDPLTGEILHATAYVYGAGLERAASFGRDTLALLRGDIEATDIQNNLKLQTWRDSLRATSTGASHTGAQHVIDIDAKDVHEANTDMNFDWIVHRASKHMPKIKAPTSADEVIEAIGLARRAVGRASENMAISRKAEAKRHAIMGTDVEALLINDEVKLRAGADPADPLSAINMNKHSPLRGASLSAINSVAKLRRKIVLERQHCFAGADFADNGLISLVKRIDRALEDGTNTLTWYGVDYPIGQNGVIDYNMVREMLTHPLYNAVMAHEVGHTLGLRHNFSGSYDAMNYRPRYWELRDDGNMRPRAWDPMTDAEIEGGINEYQYSTVMDYGQNFIVSDAHGLGYYDHAAIKMGYGDLIEVFTDAPAENALAIGSMAESASNGLFARLDRRDAFSFNFIPYTDFPELVGGVENLGKREDVRYTDLVVNANGFTGLRAMLDPQGRPPVPFVYCGDEYADFRPSCLRYDAGADSYETQQSLIDSYWNYYPFSHFQNQAIDWNVDAVVNRTYGRYLGKLESSNRIYGLWRSIFETLDFIDDDFFESETGLGAYTLGVRAGYDLLRRIVLTPEPGGYDLVQDPSGFEIYREASNRTSDFTLDEFEGRYMRTGYDFGPDFSMLFYDRAGFYHDKALALQVLTYSNITFIGQDEQADLREFATSFYTTFPDSVTSLFRSLIAHDLSAYAPRVVDGKLTYPAPRELVAQGMDAEGTIIEPNFAFSLEAVAMVEGVTNFPTSFNQDFVNRSRVWAVGAAEAVDTPNTVAFTDTTSGITYMASSYPETVSTPSGDQLVESGVGASMILRAQQLELVAQGSGQAADEARAELEDWIDNLDLMRAIAWRLGNSVDGRLQDR